MAAFAATEALFSKAERPLTFSNSTKFAAEALLYSKLLSIPADAFNVRGGALARGHVPAPRARFSSRASLPELTKLSPAGPWQHGIAAIGASGGKA